MKKEFFMRFSKPIQKVVAQGTRALMLNAMRRQVNAKIHPPKRGQEYPIVLMHGFMGFSRMEILGIKLFDYFNGVQPLLEQMGYDVWVESVSPVNPPQIRAEQWAKVVDNALAHYKTDKVHLIAHSQGGVDARVLAAPDTDCCSTPHDGQLNGIGYGDKIASIITVGAPHLGTPLADASSEKENPLQKIIMGIIDLVALMNGSTPKKAQKTIDSMSRTYMMEEFNPQIRVPNTIPCFTVAGDPADKDDVSMMFDSSWEQLNDIPVSEGGGANDGFVPVTSANYEGNGLKMADGKTPQWQALGSVCADHVAEVGIPIELKAAEHFKHLPMFAGLAQRVDTCYMEHMEMLLQADGEWERICKLINDRVAA
jgi:triacylglycerol lipase